VARVRLHAVTDGNQTFWEWRSHFSPPRSREKELVKIVGEDIYEAGFRAVALALRGHVKRPPQFSSPVTGPVSGASNAHAIVMEQHGGPEVLQYRAVTVAKPKAHEVRIRQSFIGVNYIDVYTRTGYFNLINPPGIPGMEAVGVIESVGENISGLRLGDRIAYACGPPGAYTDLRVMKPDFLVKVPDFLSDEIVAASLLKGITTSFLLHEVFAVKPGDVVLVHAAAGGVGCEHVINYSHENFADVVLNLTNGKGVDVVYDAVGKDTFANSLRALKPRGTLVSFGQASGDVGTYEIGKLASKSITLSRPNYEHYTDTREAVQMHAERFFDVVRTGAISVDLPRIFPLSQAASAHELIEGRQGTGAIVLRSQI
jgi:NADPH:quinone reductase